MSAPNKPRCACRCGYTCGGPAKCAADLTTCLTQHFKKDCAHDFTGPPWTSEDGLTCSATCWHCGMLAISHDMNVGP